MKPRERWQKACNVLRAMHGMADDIAIMVRGSLHKATPAAEIQDAISDAEDLVRELEAEYLSPSKEVKHD